MRTLADVDVRNQRVLVRADFNVPLRDGAITDDTRIRSTIPTIKALLDAGASVILMSHLGRPKGQTVEDLRLKPIALHLNELLGMTVRYARDVVGDEATDLSSSIKQGEVGLIENVRFDPREEKNDPEFSNQLAALGDVFILDAFGAAHRAHASTVGVGQILPSAAGLLMEQEVKALTYVLEDADRPLAVILGGAKVSDKIGVIENLLERADLLLIGGGMANTFLKAQGYTVGKSLLEADRVELAADLLKRASDLGVEFLIPTDVIVAKDIETTAGLRESSVDDVADDEAIFDIGSKSVEQFRSALESSRTIAWNGPMGVFEVPAFSNGTKAIAEAVASSSAYSLIGGGDSVAAVEQIGVAERISHISTGGGASLEFLEGQTLPGVAALEKKGN